MMNTLRPTRNNAPVQGQGDYIIRGVTASPITALPGNSVTLKAVIQNADGTPAGAGVAVQWQLISGELYISLSGNTSDTDSAGEAMIQATAFAPSGGIVSINVGTVSAVCGLHFSDPLISAPAVVNAETDHHLDGNEIALGVSVYIPAPPNFIVPQHGDLITFYWDNVESISYVVPDPPLFPYYIDVSRDFKENCLYDGFYELLYDYTTLVGNIHSSMSFALEITGNPPAATLPSPIFPEADAFGSLSYKSVMDNAGTDMKVYYPEMAEGDTVTATWYGYQASSGSPIPGTEWSQPRTLTANDIIAQYVLFHIPDNVITPAGDAYGQGSYHVVYLNASTALSGNTNVNIISAPMIASLHSDKTSIWNSGTDVATLTAVVQSEVAGNLLSGITVNWNTTLGTLNFSQTVTDENGSTSVELTDTQSGMATVTATPEYGQSSTVNVQINQSYSITETLPDGKSPPVIAVGQEGSVTLTLSANNSATLGENWSIYAPDNCPMDTCEIISYTGGDAPKISYDSSGHGKYCVVSTNRGTSTVVKVNMITSTTGNFSAGTYYNGTDYYHSSVSTDYQVTVATPDVAISEQKTSSGLYPLIYPGKTGAITFNVESNFTSDVAGSRIHFVAPTGTSLVSASIPASNSDYTFDAKTGDLILTKDGIVWSSCTLTLQADGSATPLTSVSDGSAQYFTADGSPAGAQAPVSVNFSCSWDYVTDVKCLIAMQFPDKSYEGTGTLFMNGTDSGGNFKAHSIPLFRGFSFTMAEGSPVSSPSKDEVQAAFTLVDQDGNTLLGQGVIDTAKYTDFQQPYNNRSTSAPNPPVSYPIELDPLTIWCSKYNNDTLPAGIFLCMQLNTPKTGGTYRFNSNNDKGVNLGLNFSAAKKYQYSSSQGRSDYILVNSSDSNSDYQYSDSGEARDFDNISYNTYHISIDPTQENSKYVFKLQWQVGMSFVYPSVDSSYSGYGSTVSSLWVTSAKDSVEWNWYPQFFSLERTSSQSLESSRVVYTGNCFAAVHEANGWARAGTIDMINLPESPAATISFLRLRVEYQSATDNASFSGNNGLDGGKSRIHLIDNFGNHIYMTPNFGAGGGTSPGMTVTINNQ